MAPWAALSPDGDGLPPMLPKPASRGRSGNRSGAAPEPAMLGRRRPKEAGTRSGHRPPAPAPPPRHHIGPCTSMRSRARVPADAGTSRTRKPADELPGASPSAHGDKGTPWLHGPGSSRPALKQRMALWVVPPPALTPLTPPASPHDRGRPGRSGGGIRPRADAPQAAGAACAERWRKERSMKGRAVLLAGILVVVTSAHTRPPAHTRYDYHGAQGRREPQDPR